MTKIRVILCYFENYAYFCTPKRENVISAPQPSPREQAWFPRAHGNEEWSSRAGFSPRQRPQEVDSI